MVNFTPWFRSTAFMLLLLSLLKSQPEVVAQDTAAPRKSEKWAVLIGVDDYAYARDLKYCGADMQGLQKELTSVGFDARQIVLLNDEAKDKRLEPYKSNIESQIELMCSHAERGDLILIAFSGHGVHSDKVSYLCPTDAKLDDRDTLISLEWVYSKLEKCQADLKLVMVDACRNVPPELNNPKDFTAEERKDSSRAFVQEAERLPRGILLLNSCSEGEFAQEDVDFGEGVFMHFVLEGIRGKADSDRDKAVTLSELFRFASKETKLHVGEKFNESQHPKLKGNLTVEALDFEIVSLAAPRRVPSQPRMRAADAPKPPLPTGDESEEIVNSIGMKLKLIPAGEFLMGSSDSDVAAALKADSSITDESPQHRVKISQPFYAGVYEVTQGEYAEVMGTNPSYFSSSGGGSDKVVGMNTTRFPVETVSWYDAIEFCNKLSEQEDLTPYYSLASVEREDGHIKSATVVGHASSQPTSGYRLPSEAEWEYLCRGGSTSAYHFGSVLNGDKANVDGNYPFGTTTKGAYLKRPTDAGSYAANRFGLHDVHGNVFEWCFDVYDESAYGSRSGLMTDPLSSSGSEYRVLRGGSWDFSSGYARSANRSRDQPVTRYNSLGFRVVR